MKTKVAEHDRKTQSLLQLSPGRFERPTYGL